MTITTETVAVGGTITASKTVSFLTGQSGGVSYTLGSGTSDGQLKYLITKENPVSWVWDTLKFPSESNNVVSLEVINDSLYMGYINGYISKWNGTQFVVEGHVGKNITSSASVGDIIFYEAEPETIQMYYGPETFTSIYKRSSDGTFSKVNQIGGTLRKIKKVDHRVYFITSYGTLLVYDNMNPSNFIQEESLYILTQMSISIKPYDLEYDSICGNIVVGASTTSPTAYVMAVACTYPPQVYNADGPINGIERVSTNTYCVYGSFNVINGLTTGGIALYNSQTNILKPLGGGINGAVTKVAVKGTDIHIVGSFTGVYQIPGGSLVSMPYMAVWSGNRTGWKPVNGGSSTLATGIRTMKTFGGYLYYGGTFSYVFTPGDSPNLFALGDSVLSYADIEVVGNVLNTYNTASIVLGPPGDSAHLVWNASLSKWCVVSPTK
jgi:hypothetical protein